MSGHIKLKQGHSWFAASWVYDHIMWLARKYIPEDCSKLLILMDEEENPLRLLRLDELSPTEVAIFRDALERAYEEAKAAGPQSFTSPEFYAGFMDRFSELMHMMSETS